MEQSFRWRTWGPVTVTCLNRPTPPVYPPLGGPTVWQLISNLSLNYLSLSGTEGRDGFQEMLRLYCFGDQPSHYQQIQGIRDMATRGTTLRTGNDAWRGFCAGTEVTLTFDESLYVGGGAFLFAAVLRHFLAMYASIDSFTQLVARRVNREEELNAMGLPLAAVLVLKGGLGIICDASTKDLSKP